jgi:GntR family transcriptional regulator of arabinose operon
MPLAADRPTPKYQQVYQILQKSILSGELEPGERLPSEAALVKQFGASRITVGRAMRDLQQEGLVERRAGSGSYVRRPTGRQGGLTFGLLIPDLGETEIFEPICQGMMRWSEARQHALLWGDIDDADDAAASKSERAWRACLAHMARRVDGVFFAPLEHVADRHLVNERIARALDAARIPLVLLDRSILPWPHRGHHDVVGLDNRRAGYTVADHLIRLGCRRVAFVARPGAASTVEARLAGYREAAFAFGASTDVGLVQRIEPDDLDAVAQFLERGRPDGIVCANDRTAAHLMQTLGALGHAVPRDLRLAGIDDVRYACLLPVPLTTLRQPCREIGATAMAAMLDRLAHPSLPPRDIALHGTLVVRQSCGAAPAASLEAD